MLQFKTVHVWTRSPKLSFTQLGPGSTVDADATLVAASTDLSLAATATAGAVADGALGAVLVLARGADLRDQVIANLATFDAGLVARGVSTDG